MASSRGSSEYDRKRDFGKTPEPQNDPGREDPRRNRKPPVFVVHRHDASRLHFDLRLEVAGALASWAVPRGFSYDPKDKRLAVRTEDHPLAYEHFEGVIPEGEYGAGTMEIWDRGTFRCIDARGEPAELGASIAKGEVKVVLDGGRLRGEWHLVKTKADERSWLLFKSRDDYSAADDRRAIDVDLRGAKRATSPPARPRRQPIVGSTAPFSDPDTWFEVEFAGARALVSLARSKRGRVQTWHGLDRRLRHTVEADVDLRRDLDRVRGRNSVLDGVLVVVDADGRPSREALEQHIEGVTTDAGGPRLQFYTFDLLHFDDLDLRGLPLRDRKATLARILPPGSEHVLFVDHVAGDGERLCASVAASGLTGVIGKQSDAPYRTTAKASDWIRIPVVPRAGGERAAELRGEVGDRITNPGKVYWPDDGLTKSDLCGYYARVADVLLPHLRDRPVHLHRFPNGIEGESFYQHKPGDGAPDWLRVVEIESSEGDLVPHIVCDDRRTLLYLANLGSIDLHPWMSRVGSLDQPDWLVLDLDPKSASFRDVVEVAQRTGDLLFELGVEPVLKTSGKTGLHVYLRLRPGYDYDQSRMFAETVARVLAKRHPDLATVERKVQKRGARVYVDYGQNRRGQTVVAPFVARPVAGATVSMPIDWRDLGDDLDPRAFTILTVPQLLAGRPEPFATAAPADLLAATEALMRLTRR